MGLINTVRDKLRSFLRIEPPQQSTITIQQNLDYYANAAKNRIWYRGNSYELSQLYNQLDVSPTVFWKASCTKGMEIRKIHTGLPKLIVDTLSNIIINDFNGVDFINSDTQRKFGIIHIKPIRAISYCINVSKICLLLVTVLSRLPLTRA